MRVVIGFFALIAIGYGQKASSSPTLSAAGTLAKRQADIVNQGLTGSSTGMMVKHRADTANKNLAGMATRAAGGCVNQPDCGEAPLTASQLQSETSIAVDTTGQHVVVGFNDFRGFTAGTVSVSGFMYSDDGGATFVDGGQLPVGPTTTLNGQLLPQVFGDPDVKYLGGCNFVYSSILLKVFSATAAVQTLSIHRSTDCGHTWSGPFEVTPATNPNGLVVSGAPRDDADKELGDVDPDTNRYGLCWSNFTPAAVGGVEISCTYSDNVVTGTPPTFSTRKVVAAASQDGQGSSVRFAGNASPNAYTAWSRFPGTFGGYANNIGFSRSTDNGVTWSAPVNLASDFITMDQVLGNDRVNNFPSVAVDNSAGAFAGSVYIVYSNNNSFDGADVVLQKSTNGGVTFSPPIYLNAKPGADRAQWFPFVTVDRTTGRVWVYYYDQGVASSGDLTQVTYLYSDNGGSAWSKPAAVDRQFKAGWGNDTSQPNLGDYIQSVAQNGTLYAVYAASKQPRFADGQPLTSMPFPDVFFSKVTGAAPPSLRIGAVTFTETAGDGNIDPGDQVRLKIPLENYVTNSLNAASVTGISATLSTSTLGVSVTQAASTYPDATAGATTVNSSDFILQIASGFAPGTPIELVLTIGTAQGPLSLPLTQQTGTPVYTTLLNENFDGVSPGALPSGWTAAHGAGTNTVPWRTSNTFATALCGTSNKAFHANANDGATVSGDQARWERLFSPILAVPANSQYVTVEFDVCYDTEDDPNLPRLGYDGFFLRITDQTPGRTLRSVLAEAFEQEFTTGPIQHYPKHFPRNSDTNYFDDMSAWSGFSNGPQHVRMRLPGMEGSNMQLRFEFAQDQVGICSDVRPGHACGVSVDNVVVRSVISIAPLPANIIVQPAFSRDGTTNEVVASLRLTNTGGGTASNVQMTSALLTSTPTTTGFTNLGTIAPGASLVTTVRFPGGGFTSGAAAVLRVGGSFTGGSFSSTSRVTIP